MKQRRIKKMIRLHHQLKKKNKNKLTLNKLYNETN